MVRLIAVTVLELVANAIGLLVAKWLLPGFVSAPSGFVWVDRRSSPRRASSWRR